MMKRGKWGLVIVIALILYQMFLRYDIKIAEMGDRGFFTLVTDRLTARVYNFIPNQKIYLFPYPHENVLAPLEQLQVEQKKALRGEVMRFLNDFKDMPPEKQREFDLAMLGQHFPELDMEKFSEYFGLMQSVSRDTSVWDKFKVNTKK
jgi:hypothetical protein